MASHVFGLSKGIHYPGFPHFNPGFLPARPGPPICLSNFLTFCRRLSLPQCPLFGNPPRHFAVLVGLSSRTSPRLVDDNGVVMIRGCLGPRCSIECKIGGIPSADRQMAIPDMPNAAPTAVYDTQGWFRDQMVSVHLPNGLQLTTDTSPDRSRLISCTP